MRRDLDADKLPRFSVIDGIGCFNMLLSIFAGLPGKYLLLLRFSFTNGDNRAIVNFFDRTVLSLVLLPLVISDKA